MSPKLRLACNIALTSSMIAALASSGISEAQPGIPQLLEAQSPEAQMPKTAAQISTEIPALPVEQSIEQSNPTDPASSNPVPSNSGLTNPAPANSAPTRAVSLASLVTSQPHPAELPRELNCLAGAIYFEAKSESLSGQLAVGRVIVARSKSGRFPNSYCGVVFQPSQFSFVRGGGMPGIARSSQQWRNAVAIAQIAHAGSWRSPVEGALYFHAAYVSPTWRLARVGRVENHVFYR